MIFLANIDPNLPKLVLIAVLIIGLGVLLRFFRQPYVIAYILAGVLIGEHGFSILTDKLIINSLGEFGLILLLFFIGMEVNLSNLLNNWKLSLIGTTFQVLVSVIFAGILGSFLGWSLNLIIIMGFILSLSSSAVVFKLLEDSGENASPIGQNVISILLMQDIFIVPMLIIANYLGGARPAADEIILQLIGSVLIIGTIIWLVRKKEIKLPYSDEIEKDHELQVFIAFIFCFGFALATALFGLSAALGAFVAGVMVHSAKSTEWFHDSLHSFRIVFVAVFFVSIGMLIDLDFLFQNWPTIISLLVVVYFSNHFINAIILHYFGNSNKDSLYGGALLAQVGELSFVLAASGFYAQIISTYVYQTTILVIALTLLVSPFWVGITKAFLKRKSK